MSKKAGSWLLASSCFEAMRKGGKYSGQTKSKAGRVSPAFLFHHPLGI